MSTVQDFSSRTQRSFSARKIFVTLALTSTISGALSNSVAAQSTPEKPDHWEFRASSGALVPTGSARNTVKDAALSTAQLSYLVRPLFAITGTFGWARSRDRLTEGQPKLDAFLYDLGAEFRLAPLFSASRFAVAPFVGAGAGAQSYNYRSLNTDATHNMAGYGAIGGEMGVRRVRLRLEVRDYVSGFKPLSGIGESRTHNDIVITAAFRITKHSSH